MKLQLALDLTDINKAKKICEKTKNYVDIIELGTPLIKQNGIKCIKEFKKFKKVLVADFKTMDTGFLEAEIAFKAGADISTVCANADIDTIRGSVKASKKYNKKISVDLINVKNIRKRVKEINKISPKVDYICVHTGIDQQNKGEKPLEIIIKIHKLIPCKKISIAGGINEKNIGKILKFNPEVVIVGGAITKSKNPEKSAEKIKSLIKNERN